VHLVGFIIRIYHDAARSSMSKAAVVSSSCSRTIQLVVSLHLLLSSSMKLLKRSPYGDVGTHSAAQAMKAVPVHTILA
jgi:hypothetical protein